MARLPQPGFDAGAWGVILNDFLQQEHNPDGSLKIRTDGTLAAKEAVIAPGTTAQYWRGDKTWQTLDKTAVGLANVDNTSDVDKPVSTATQTALSTKVSKSGDSMAGDLTFPANVSLVFDTVQQYLRWDTSEGLWLAVASDNKNLKLSYGGGSGRLVIDQYGFGEVARFTNGVLSMRSHQIKDTADPTDAQDAATKNYVDSGGWASVPATATSTGQVGQKAFDNDFLYLCVTTNTWRRVPLSSW